MTSDDTDDVVHFRGKTLTPESPRPLHISEPSTIPVLENQTDPTFNDTFTYENLSCIKEDEPSNVSLEVEDPIHLTKQVFSRTVELFRDGANTFGSVDTGEQQNADGFSASTQRNRAESGNGPTFPVDNGTDVTEQCASSHLDNKYINNSNHDLATNDASFIQPDPKPLSYQSVPSDTQSTDSHTLSQPEQYQQAPESHELTSPRPEPSAHDQSVNFNDDDTARHRNFPDDEVNFQNLLDNLSQSTSPPNDANTVPGGPTLPNPSGLPPRPPPQEKPSMHPNYSPTDDIRSFHPLKTQASGGAAHHTHNNFHPCSNDAAGPPSSPKGPSSHPPHAASQSQSLSPALTSTGATYPPPQGERQDDDVAKLSHLGREGETPWGPEVQKKYDKFLIEERAYVTEGLWDRFPLGSRLFVGNLPTERVTKRDLFHLFHKYGKLAQISIKQAYGFIQFAEASSCRAALEAEQGGIVKGRKIHLEISKPQRNTRPAPPSETHKAPSAKNSGSPESGRGREIGRGRRPSVDRYDRPQGAGRLPCSDFRRQDRAEHHRRRDRDDYRPPRSSSPRGFRRDGYRSRDRSLDRYDHHERRRSRSPYERGRYASPSSRDRNRDYEAEPYLPIPKRSPRLIPDVQILVLEDIDRQFIYRIESVFRDRGLRSDVLILSPRIDLSAVVHRQVIEGVLAIVKVSRSNQYSGRIPLKVFDRSSGANNIRFNEYSELDMNVAGDVVLHAWNVQSASNSTQSRPPQTLGGPPPAQPLQNSVAQRAIPNNVGNLISALDGPALQSLLGALQQQQQQPVSAAPGAVPQPYALPNTNPTLASLLGFANRPNLAVSSLSATNPMAPAQSLGNPMAGTSFTTDPNLASLLAKGLGDQFQNQAPQQNPQVHNIINQLAKWRQ